MPEVNGILSQKLCSAILARHKTQGGFLSRLEKLLVSLSARVCSVTIVQTRRSSHSDPSVGTCCHQKDFFALLATSGSPLRRWTITKCAWLSIVSKPVLCESRKRWNVRCKLFFFGVLLRSGVRSLMGTALPSLSFST